MNCHIRRACVVFASFSFLIVSYPSYANVFQDVWRILIDPIKIRQSSVTLSDSLDRTMAQLNTLEGVTNGHAKERIDQIRLIVADALSGSQALLAKANGDMLALEAQVNSDAINLIYRAQCAAEKTLEQGREAVKDIVYDLGRADPSISILGLKIINFRTRQVEIIYPDMAYWDTKKKFFEYLRKNVRDDSEAHNIFSAYINLQSLAKFALCRYMDQRAATEYWTQEINQMEVLAEPWTKAVHVK